MVAISINNATYNVEGEDAVILREKVGQQTTQLLELQRQLDDANSILATRKEVQETLESEKRLLDSKVATLEAELTASQVKMENLADSMPDLNSLIQERVTLWQEVKDSLSRANPNFKPDYTLNPTAVKAIYLKTAHKDRADLIANLDARQSSIDSLDASAVAYVDALYDALRPAEVKTSITDSVLDAIEYSRTLDHGEESDEALRESLRKRLETRA